MTKGHFSTTIFTQWVHDKADTVKPAILIRLTRLVFSEISKKVVSKQNLNINLRWSLITDVIRKVC